MLAAVLLVLATGPAIVPSAVAGTLEVHEPLLIIGDGDLCDQETTAILNCDSALGTSTDPYRIAGWKITSDPSLGLHALEIRDTTKHIVVEDNALLTEAGAGLVTVVLSNVENLSLRGNEIVAGDASAVQIRGTSDVHLDGNLIRSATDENSSAMAHALVDLRDVSGLKLTGNTLRANTDVHTLLTVEDAPAVHLRENSYAPSGNDPLPSTALRLHRSSNAEIVDETVRDLKTGLNLTSSDGTSISGANLSGVYDGILAKDMGTLSLDMVTVADNYPCHPCESTSSGLYLESTTLHASNVQIAEFDTGIHTLSAPDTAAPDLTADGLDVTGNGIGVLVEAPGTVEITQSNIHDNVDWGVKNDASVTVDATDVWWGHADGPSTEENPDAGDAIDGDINYQPWATSSFTL